MSNQPGPEIHGWYGEGAKERSVLFRHLDEIDVLAWKREMSGEQTMTPTPEERVAEALRGVDVGIEYVGAVAGDKICLDGWFAAPLLRVLADALEGRQAQAEARAAGAEEMRERCRSACRQVAMNYGAHGHPALADAACVCERTVAALSLTPPSTPPEE